MFKGLWLKFLLLFVSISAVALSSSFLLREFMIRDFRHYIEGVMEDRVYQLTAEFEGAFERYSGWKDEEVAEKVIHAFLSGIEVRLSDTNGRIIMDRQKAMSMVTPLMKRRVMAITGTLEDNSEDKFTPYPLFLGGKEIGTLEIRFLTSPKVETFIRRSNRFLIITMLCLGGLSILLSLFFSKRLTSPIKRLSNAAESIRRGDLNVRVPVKGGDEIARLSDTFNRMARSLEIQENLRKNLLSNVAHELRTPLGVIRGELEGIIDGLIAVNKEELQTILEEVQRLSRIVEGIEDFAHAQASFLNLKRQTIQLRSFLQEILNSLRARIKRKDLSLELYCDDELTIYADPERLGQIVINLLSNSIKATGDGGRIWIRAEKEPSQVILEFGDTGCGIRQEELPFIFERFYRGFSEGLGLGLSIVKELVEAHEGKIEVFSEYGKGTVFKLYFPSSIHNSS